MPVSNIDIRQFLIELPPRDRLALARELLDSIQDDENYWQLDADLAGEVQRRRVEMLRGEQTVPDWRAALESIRVEIESGPKL